MNRKFDHCVSQKDVTSCRRDIVMSDTSGLYDYPFNYTWWSTSILSHMCAKTQQIMFMLKYHLHVCINDLK